MRNSLFSDPPLTSIFLTGVICLFFPSQRVNLSFDFPFYGHLLREITVATGGKWTLFLVSVFSLVVITVVVGYTVCAWHFWLYTDCFLLLLDLGGNAVRFMKWVWSRKTFMKWRRKRERAAHVFLVLGVPVSVVATVQRHLTPEYSKETKQWVITFFSGKLHQKILGCKRLVWHENRRQHSASQAVSLIHDRLQPSPLWDSLLDEGGIRKNKPLPTLSTTNSTPDWTGRETRLRGLDWKQESLCQGGPAHPDRHG